jgi:ankyrin repeat protein
MEHQTSSQVHQEEKGNEMISTLSPTTTDEGIKTSTKKTNLISLTYNGQTIITAASQGNLPVCVLLWGMASAKKINIMSPDIHGNNPMHYACLAQTSEVMGFFHQQLRGMLTSEIRLVDSVNHAGETPLLRAMTTGQMTVIKVRGKRKGDFSQ